MYPFVDLTEANSNPNLPNCGTVAAPRTCQWGYTAAQLLLKDKVLSRPGKAVSTSTTYSGYVSGPIIKDKLFAFVAVESAQGNTTSYSGYSAASTAANPDGPLGTMTRGTTETNTTYVKLDWNINDNNLLQYTYMGSKYLSKGRNFDYWLNTDKLGNLRATTPTPVSQNQEFSILQYTGYLTNNLTLNAMYGHGRFTSRQVLSQACRSLPPRPTRIRQSPVAAPSSRIPYSLTTSR
jgi:hypothetical protein